MSLITIPINAEIEQFIKSQIDRGYFSSKSDLVRTAINKFREESEIDEILKARGDVAAKRYFKGDLDTLSKSL
jgi:Arc/MetJ-type ribon-helix-helix transcriptional regulator